MLKVKGFVTIAALVTNVKDSVSRLGELSPISRTFSKEIGEYVSNVYQGYTLNTFNSIDSTTNQHTILSQGNVDFCLGVIRSIYGYASTNIRPYNTADFIATVKRSFSGVIGDLVFGEYIEDVNIGLPEWVEFNNITTGASYRIWLADSAFQRQYDLFDITVIPFLNNANDYFLPFESINALLDAGSMSSFMEKIQTYRDAHPDTKLYIMEFDLVNRNNTNRKRKVPFGILIYGYAGDNIDYIKDKIIDYLLEKSTHTRSEWEVLLPEIFKRTEFSIYPRWDLIAIPNLTNMAGIHRSMVDYNEVKSFTLLAANQYTDSHILNNIEIVPHVYKSLSLVFVSGETNDVTVNRIRNIFPDYVPIQNTALDYARMSISTREWCDLLYNLIKVAETATQYSTIPENMRRMVRRNKIYITAIYKGVNYLVSAKINGN